MKHPVLISFAFFLFFPNALSLAQSGPPRRPVIIRDTGAGDTTEKAEAQKPKEFNPMLAKKNIDIGNFYYKKNNYEAAIQRYLLALEYQPDSLPAHEALGRAYEKHGDISKALELYNKFIKENPDSPKTSEFRDRIARLKEKS